MAFGVSLLAMSLLNDSLTGLAKGNFSVMTTERLFKARLLRILIVILGKMDDCIHTSSEKKI